MSVKVKPGTLQGTQITFDNEGNQSKGKTTGDVVVTIQYAKHKSLEIINVNESL